MDDEEYGALAPHEVRGVLGIISAEAARREEMRDGCCDDDARAYQDGFGNGLRLAWSWLAQSARQARRVSELSGGAR